MGELYAFFGREHVGTFHENNAGAVSFRYTDGYAGTPLSLSLPLDGRGTSAAAPRAFLDNLLPDRVEVRQRWARERGLASAGPFDLLAAYGEDVSGAVSLSADPGLGSRDLDPATVVEATDDDIAARIASLANDTTSWTDPRVKPRMSIAGAQGKFTLARAGDQWFWPTYEFPSTHIVKPPSREFKDVEALEYLSLELARRAGVPAARSGVDEFLGQRAFITERWDRADRVRLHAEDLNQALGRPTADKYKVRASEVAALLDRHGMADAFVSQLAFSAAMGNGDAHAKNYSILLSGSQVALSPIYDTVPTFMWPNLNSNFAMRIGNARRPSELSEKNWRKFADSAGLDGDRVCERAFPVMASVAEHYEDMFAPVLRRDPRRARMVAKLTRAVGKVIPPRWSTVVPPAAPAARPIQQRPREVRSLADQPAWLPGYSGQGGGRCGHMMVRAGVPCVSPAGHRERAHRSKPRR